jgi:single-strand DNA-binding protein
VFTINKAILIGNLTRDPELRTSQNGNAVCTFTLAVNRRFTDANGNRQADFINVVAFKKLAEICSQYLAKGRKCGVVGSIQTRTYDAQDGTKRYVTEIIADEVEFLGQPAGQHEQRGDAWEPEVPSASGADDELPF